MNSEKKKNEKLLLAPKKENSDILKADKIAINIHFMCVLKQNYP